MQQENFDYIIVGAGTAGCLIANRLSRDPSKTVLLLEAGRRDTYLWIHIPVGYLYCIGNPRTDWLYETAAEPGLGGRALRYPRGKVLGGCSSINGMIYMRGQARDYDGWARLTGEPAWRWDNVLPDFIAHENHYRLADGADPATGANGRFSDFHGHGGEWRIEKQRLRWDILEAFEAAANEAGIHSIDDYNTGDNEGIGAFEVTQKSGWRWNTSRAFLRPAQHRRNLTVWTEAHAERLLFETTAGEQPRCTGVAMRRGGQPLRVQARGEVILSAGAVGSPHILQLSGIGPAPLLAAHGIDVLLDLPGVGENLQDHLQIRHDFQSEKRQDAQYAGRQPLWQSDDRPRISGAPHRADEHGAEPARRLHPLQPRPPPRQCGISRPAAQPGCLRRTAPPLPGLHGERLQSQSRQPRHGEAEILPLRRPA